MRNNKDMKHKSICDEACGARPRHWTGCLADGQHILQAGDTRPEHNKGQLPNSLQMTQHLLPLWKDRKTV